MSDSLTSPNTMGLVEEFGWIFTPLPTSHNFTFKSRIGIEGDCHAEEGKFAVGIYSDCCNDSMTSHYDREDKPVMDTVICNKCKKKVKRHMALTLPREHSISWGTRHPEVGDFAQGGMDVQEWLDNLMPAYYDNPLEATLAASVVSDQLKTLRREVSKFDEVYNIELRGAFTMARHLDLNSARTYQDLDDVENVIWASNYTATRAICLEVNAQ